MNELKVFDFEQHDVRTVVVENEPWFVGRDVAIQYIKDLKAKDVS